MKLKYFLGGLVVVLMIMSTCVVVLAQDISLDGSFNDWADKPGLKDKTGDELPRVDLVEVKWYPDNDSKRLYLYCERDMSKWHIFDFWMVEVSLKSDLGERKAYVFYNPETRIVSVWLYDKNGKYLWSANGIWGDIESIANGMEFYIPLEYLVSSVTAGYEIDLIFTSGTDKAPNKGSIKVSTISTYPFETIIGLCVLLTLLLWVRTAPYGIRKFIEANINNGIIIQKIKRSVQKKGLS